ncbi:MAG TPA: radical SAM protein [Longimicrobiales bacterium]|nr:radical SAM protein [Longimicrobiales bacterium]
MTGTRTGTLSELVSPFLREKLAEARAQGEDSRDYQAIWRQYIRDPRESSFVAAERTRHYESEVHIEFEGQNVPGIERLYRRTILIEPTTACAAHCRWCLRGQYPIQTLKPDQVELAARYIGSESVRDDLREVLVTGGDPLMSVPLLRHTLSMLRRHAPNISIVRIGTRVPVQDPRRVDDAMLDMFAGFHDLRLELGLNINHPVEFWPESVAALQRLQRVGIRMYNQHPLLRGVNDDLSVLTELYGLLRDHGIEAHYLFHAIPMRGTAHHRTSLDRGLQLANALDSCGEFSGRAKPRFAVLSDLGKIVLHEGAIVERREQTNEVLIRSGYRLDDRLRWNPGWRVPPGTTIAPDGTMMTWYLDADERAVQPASLRVL